MTEELQFAMMLVVGANQLKAEFDKCGICSRIQLYFYLLKNHQVFTHD
jgi:hypothetical protein